MPPTRTKRRRVRPLQNADVKRPESLPLFSAVSAWDSGLGPKVLGMTDEEQSFLMQSADFHELTIWSFGLRGIWELGFRALGFGVQCSRCELGLSILAFKGSGLWF